MMKVQLLLAMILLLCGLMSADDMSAAKKEAVRKMRLRLAEQGFYVQERRSGAELLEMMDGNGSFSNLKKLENA